MNTRHLVKLAPAFAAMLLLGGCPPTPANALVNETGQEIRVDNWDQGSVWSMWARQITLRPGQRYNGMSIAPSDQRVLAGDCVYLYPDLNPDLARALYDDARSAGRWVHGTKIVEFRIQPDFTIRVFTLAEDGKVLGEFTAPQLPARPTVECRSTG